MSEILVDNLTGKTSAGSITVTSEGGAATQSLQQGLAKAWIRFNGSGTIAVTDSLNIASITDNGTGDYSNTFTNSMSNNDYLFGGFSASTGSGDYARIFTPRGTGSDVDASTTAYRGRSHQSWTGTVEDNPIVSSLTHGDLA